MTRYSSTIIVTDQLYEFDFQAKVTNFFCEKYERADLCTIGFNIDRIPPAFTNKKIFSSYLSSFVKTKKQFQGLEFLHPWAIKSIKLNQDVEKVISISTGYAHLIEVPNNVEHISYILGEDSHLSSLQKFFFGKTLRDKKNSSLKNISKVCFSNSEIMKSFSENFNKKSKYDVIPPFLDQDEFSYRNDIKVNDILKESFKKVIVNLNNIPKDVFDFFCNFKSDKYELIFIGDNEQIEKLETNSSFNKINDKLQRDICDGLITPVFQDCLCYINFENSMFPENVFKSFLVGLPVMSFNEYLKKNPYLSNLDLNIFKFNTQTFEKSLGLIEQNYLNEEFKKDLIRLKRHAQSFNDRVFSQRLESFESL